MPYYQWRGVDLNATIRKGTHFAPSEHELDQLLLQQDIALLNCHVLKAWFIKPISAHNVGTFFVHLSSLIKAGIPLPQALRLISQRTTHKYFALIIQEISCAVSDGILLPDAMAKKPHLFSPVMIATIATGLETGNLSDALDFLNAYLERRISITKKIRAALLMPLITFGFFLIVSLIMMIVLVPRFALLLQSVNRDLPTATKRLLAVSDFLTSFYGWAIILGGVIVSWIVYRLVKKYIAQKKWDYAQLSIPLLSSFIFASQAGAYFHTVGMLVSAGMHVVPAMHLAKKAVSNLVLREQFKAAAVDVNAGHQLHHALSAHTPLLLPEIISMIAIGEETSTLGLVFGAIGKEYYEQLYKKLGLISSLVQPALMICLGLLITSLILAIYTPVFSLSYAV